MKFELSKDNQFIQLVEWKSDKDILKLQTFFKRQTKNFFFDPEFKKGNWDGYDHFFTNGFINIGLWLELEKFLNNNNYPVQIDGLKTFINKSFHKDKLIEFTVDLLRDTQIFEPRYYQMEAAYRILKYRYCAEELATSAGKTLISYIVFAYLKKLNLINKDAKMLLIVPRKGLIDQTADKFEKDYYNGFIEFNLMRLGGKYKFKQKLFDEADIVISTYQSLANRNDEFFAKIKHINVDEAHTVLTKTVRKVIEKCTPLIYRFGLSGTLKLDVQFAEFFRMQKYLGPLVMVLTAKDLIEQEYSPKVNIRVINLHYNPNDEVINTYTDHLENGASQWADKAEFGKEMYKLERGIIVEHEERIQFITKLASSLKHNTLILFNNVKDKYGFNIGERLKTAGETVFYIDGDTKDAERAEYTKLMETPNHFTILKFGNIEIKVNQYKSVKLKNGTIKYAKDINIDDDVSDKWIELNNITTGIDLNKIV